MLRKRIKTRKGAQFAAWIVGIVIFFDDYFNCLTNGSVMRPVSDKYQISREKFSYIVDSTAVGICLVAPLSSWVAFTCSLISDAFGVAGIEGDSYITFLKSIPFNYYAWLSIFMVLMVVFFQLDFGPMAKAEKRVQTTGTLCLKTFGGGDANEDDFSSIEVKEGKAGDLLGPIALLYVLAIVFVLFTGGFFESYDLIDAFQEMDGLMALIYAIGLASIFAIILYALKRLSKVNESIMAYVVGTKSMLYVIILLAFAWSLGTVCDELGTAEYLVDVMLGTVPPQVVPFLIFICACLMTFATGATWGTFAIMIPLAIPIAVQLDASVLACLTAVLGGGGFGGHCSPLADTAILSSASSNIRHIDHVKTQIPYSVSCAAVASVGYLVTGFLGPDSSPIIPLIVIAALFCCVLFVLNKLFGAGRYSVADIKSEAADSADE
jgi:Na+/H+ antiporter NhaC